MKLKNRMVISFFVIILVPLILTGVAVAGFTMYQVWSLEKKYGIEGVTYENLSNNTMLLSKMTQRRDIDLVLRQLQRVEENILHTRENGILGF